MLKLFAALYGGSKRIEYEVKAWLLSPPRLRSWRRRVKLKAPSAKLR